MTLDPVTITALVFVAVYLSGVTIWSFLADRRDGRRVEQARQRLHDAEDELFGQGPR